MSDEITPFRIAITDDELGDLKRCLRATRWPERECVDDWTQGLPLAYAQEVASYWLEKYDWRAREALLNRFPQFKTEIDGLGIHFIHVRSPHPDATPLLVTHGWPGSIVEFQKIIEPLTNPTAHGGEAADAFHLVCPSLPGYGFSDKPTRRGWNVQRIANAWSELMLRLGYKRYAAQGGDWGAAITTCIGFQDPANCLGIHVNLPLVLHLLVRIDPSSSDLTVMEKSAFAGFRYYNDWDSGYSKEQSTRPQTVGYGLSDSLVGQMAWILEKFWAWTDCGGHPENVLSRDELFFQCKRYKGSVSAGAIRDFRGAMVGRTDKGLLITTGHFTADAKREATRDGAPQIELIDGEQLCDLLKSLKLGLKTELVEHVIVTPETFKEFELSK